MSSFDSEDLAGPSEYLLLSSQGTKTGLLSLCNEVKEIDKETFPGILVTGIYNLRSNILVY